MTMDDATAAIASAGLVPRTELVTSDEAPGTVLSQDPAGGTRIGTGSQVNIRVASPVGQD